VRNRVLFVCALVFWLCGAGCNMRSKEPVVVDKPVEIPPSRILTLSEQQLVSLDWHNPNRTGVRVKGKRIVPGPGVEFDISFSSNSPGNRSLDFVSSGKGGRGTLVGTDIRGYEAFALKLTLVSINGQSGPELKQKLVAGAVIGPTETGQLCTYEPVTLGFATSEKTVIAKTPVLTDKIYQIGFHVHMLNPEDWDQSGSMMTLRVEPVEDGGAVPHENFYGNDVLTYTISDDKSGTDTTSVNATVKMVNDAPAITSAPVTTATAGVLYIYDVDAADPDAGDTLTYSLTSKPADMTIHSATGLIQWKPTNAQAGANKVVVKVVDSNSIPALDTQSFTITVNPAPPKIATLTVLDGYNQKNKKTLSADSKTHLVQSSDNNRWGTGFGSYISYDFSDVFIPADALITSVVVFVEHFEEERFAQGKLEWAVGTGWPTKPVVWASINAPVHEGQSYEAVDSWDVTNIVDTREKINSLQLQVKNNDNIGYRKTLIDYIYVQVEWN